MGTQQTNERQRAPRHQGGQHRASVGLHTLDGETPAEFVERHCRAYVDFGEPAPFDIDTAPDAETGAVRDVKALEQFNRERQRAIDPPDWSQPF